MRALQILSARRKSKRFQNSMSDVKTRNRMKSELIKLLNSVLEDNDRVLIEVEQCYLTDFIEILDDPSMMVFNSVQIAPDKFEFANRELVL